jgi:hypothetical protein
MGNRWDFDSHKEDALREDVQFLLTNGSTLEQVADRLGMKYGTLRDKVTAWEKEEQ